MNMIKLYVIGFILGGLIGFVLYGTELTIASLTLSTSFAVIFVAVIDFLIIYFGGMQIGKTLKANADPGQGNRILQLPAFLAGAAGLFCYSLAGMLFPAMPAFASPANMFTLIAYFAALGWFTYRGATA